MITKLRTHFKEATQNTSEPFKFRVVLIQEGLGNLHDCFFYTKDCLKNGPGVFEGKKCYVDHPSEFEEEVRPERSTRDILGHFENVSYQETEDGRGMLTADLVTIQQESFGWAQALIANSITYSQKFQESDFIGLSINASGEANQVPLAQFLNQNSNLSPSILPKLAQAQSEGIENIRIVSQLTEAVSCDLVTEAGAGGRILQLLERNKKPMKFRKFKEMHKQSEDGAMPPHPMGAPAGKDGSAGADGQGADGAAGDHADAGQDAQLFHQLIQQYLGDDHEDDGEAEAMAQAAYEACQADGMEHEAAMEAVGKHLKMAKAIGEKMAGAGKMPKQKAPKMPMGAGESEGMEMEDEAHECGKQSEGESEGNMESALGRQLVRANARIARLEESVKRTEVAKYLERKLQESKLPNVVTKKFREALGLPKSKEQIDQSWKIFTKAYEGLAEEVDEADGFLFTEKSYKGARTGNESEGFGSLSDCVDE